LSVRSLHEPAGCPRTKFERSGTYPEYQKAPDTTDIANCRHGFRRGSVSRPVDAHISHTPDWDPSATRAVPCLRPN